MPIEDILAIEKQFIYLLLHHKSLVSDWIDSNLNMEYFHVEYRTLLMAIMQSYDNGVVLTRKTFVTFIKELKTHKERIQQEMIFNNCFSFVTSKNDFPLLMNQIIEAYLYRTSIDIIKRFAENKDKKGIIFAIKDMTADMQDLNNHSLLTGQIIYDDMRNFSKEHIDYIEGVRSGAIKEEPRLLCNIKEIDDTMGIGFSVGTLTLFCGQVGGFKSSLMLNVGLNIWKQNYNVLFVPIEMHKKQMYNRAWAREARVDSNKISDPKKLTDEEVNKLKEAQKIWENQESKFYIMQTNEQMTVSCIQRQIEKYLTIFAPRLVVIDYIDNLTPDINRQGRHDIEISDMLQELRRIGRNMQFAVVSGAQLGREVLRRIRRAGASRDQTSIYSEDIRGAHTFASDADNVYAMMPSNAQPTALLDIYVVKAREGKQTFANGNFKETLMVLPEFSLIQSQSTWSIPDDDTMNELIQNEETTNSIVPSNNNVFSNDNIMDEIVSELGL